MTTNIVVPIDELTDVWGLRPVAGGVWTPGNYVVGAVASHEGALYFANKQTSAEPGTNADWTLLIAAAFSAVRAFVAGIEASAVAPVTLVTEGGTLYACTESHTTTSTFEPSKWLALVSSSAGAVVEVSGGWNASTNTPSLASSVGTNGALYRVTVAGNTVLDGTGDWNVGDYALFSLNAWRKIRSHNLFAKDILDSTAAGRALVTGADVPAQRASLRIDGVTTVDDANATITSATSRIAYINLTASRSVSLDAAAGFALGQSVEVFDETGSCAPARTITINRSASDTINGQTSYVLAAPYAGVRLTRSSASKWTAHPMESMRGIRAVSSGSYAYVAADARCIVVRTAPSAMTDYLPVFGQGYSVDVQNAGTGILTITPDSGTIAGLSSLSLPPGSGAYIVCDGVNYRVAGVIPSAQGKWLLTTLTAANSATLSSNTVLQSGFNGYEIVLEDIVPVSNSETLAMRFHSGGSYAATNYRSAGSAASEVSLVNTGALSTGVQLTRTGVVSNAGMGISGSFMIRATQDTTSQKPIFGQSVYMVSSYLETASVSGVWQSNAALDGVQIFFGAGNIASGKMRIYGVA